MSRRCLNPGCYQGDPGDPPEFESDNEKTCRSCGAGIDIDDDDFTTDSEGGYRCDDCKVIPDEEEDDE